MSNCEGSLPTPSERPSVQDVMWEVFEYGNRQHAFVMEEFNGPARDKARAALHEQDKKIRGMLELFLFAPSESTLRFEEKPVAWLIVCPHADPLIKETRHVVLSPLTDDTYMDEGDAAYPLFREVYTQEQLEAADARSAQRTERLRTPSAVATINEPVAWLGRRVPNAEFPGHTSRESVSFDRQQLITIGYSEKEITPLYTVAPSATGPTSEPYGYLWYTKHMERRFTHKNPTGMEGVIGDVVPVYLTPQPVAGACGRPAKPYEVRVCRSPQACSFGRCDCPEATATKNTPDRKGVQK